MTSALLHHLFHLERHEITGFRPRVLVLEPILVLGCLDLGTQKLASGSDVPGIPYGVWSKAEIWIIQTKTENTSPTNIFLRVWLSTTRSFMYLHALSMICVPAFTRTVLLVPGRSLSSIANGAEEDDAALLLRFLAFYSMSSICLLAVRDHPPSIPLMRPSLFWMLYSITKTCRAVKRMDFEGIVLYAAQNELRRRRRVDQEEI